MAEPAPNEKSRLQEHFADGGVDSGSKWAELWNTNFTPWDRGLPNPALEDLLQDRSDLIGSCWRINEAGVRQRRTAFVPACGKGYDVLLFASYGFDAYGLEISGAAVEECRKVQAQESDKYPERDHESGTGKVEYILGDFFSESWLEKVEGDKTFDLIYDYTVRLDSPSCNKPKVSDTNSLSLALSSNSSSVQYHHHGALSGLRE